MTIRATTLAAEDIRRRIDEGRHDGLFELSDVRVLLAEIDALRRDVARREREHAALVETSQSALETLRGAARSYVDMIDRLAGDDWSSAERRALRMVLESLLGRRHG